jgi:diaminohydroxyphosphoribosylaminopyrimidine deaminase/5-amino-6-(5-phosphoribosylamino)uracil reductase
VSSSNNHDERFMAVALGLARRSLGSTWPNPAVGCVLVRHDSDRPAIVGRGWTASGGRPHAETEALKRAGGSANGATAYVTLEPCSHHGRTPPCAEALVEAQIARAVIAIEDPDPRVSGQGIKVLQDAGVAVSMNVLADAAHELNAGFFARIKQSRPLVTLKMATTLDGRIATAAGDSQWITSAPARHFAHRLRAANDAVAVGIGTVLADDPELTCRLPGMTAHSPLRVVFDSKLRMPAKCLMVKSARETRTIVLTLSGGDAARRRKLTAAGVEMLEVEAGDDGRVGIPAALEALAGMGVSRLLCEGGGALAGSLMRSGVVDRIAWFRAPSMFGGDGLPSIGAFGVDKVADAPVFVRSALARVGPDVLETYRRPT